MLLPKVLDVQVVNTQRPIGVGEMEYAVASCWTRVHGPARLFNPDLNEQTVSEQTVSEQTVSDYMNGLRKGKVA